MSTIKPKGEKIRQAVRWISENLKDDSRKAIISVIQEAALRFNLSPKEEEFLVSFYREQVTSQVDRL